MTVLGYELANGGSLRRYWERDLSLSLDQLLSVLEGVATGITWNPMYIFVIIL